MWEIIRTSLPQLLAAGFKYTNPLSVNFIFLWLNHCFDNCIDSAVTPTRTIHDSQVVCPILRLAFPVDTIVGPIIYCFLWTAIFKDSRNIASLN